MILNDRDLITLNAYVDGALSPAERAAFEKRLASDPALQQEMDALKATVALLHKVERVRVPRNFTLDPAKYGAPAHRSLLDRLGFISLPQLVTAGGTLAAMLICVGLLVYGPRLMTGAASAPEQVMLENQADEAAADSDAAREATVESFAAAPAEDVPCDELSGGTCPNAEFAPPGAGGSDSSGSGGPAGTGPVMSPQPVEPTVIDSNADVAETTQQGPVDGNGDDAYAQSGPADEPSTKLPIEEDFNDEPPPPVSLPLVPLAVSGLVIVLAAGMLVARRARRR